MRLTPALREQIAEHIARGVTTREIAEKFAIHEQTVYRLKRLGRLPPAKKTLPAAEVGRIEVLLYQCPTIAEVARLSGRHRHTVEKIAARLDRRHFGQYPGDAAQARAALEQAKRQMAAAGRRK